MMYIGTGLELHGLDDTRRQCQALCGDHPIPSLLVCLGKEERGEQYYTLLPLKPHCMVVFCPQKSNLQNPPPLFFFKLRTYGVYTSIVRAFSKRGHHKYGVHIRVLHSYLDSYDIMG